MNIFQMHTMFRATAQSERRLCHRCGRFETAVVQREANPQRDNFKTSRVSFDLNSSHKSKQPTGGGVPELESSGTCSNMTHSIHLHGMQNADLKKKVSYGNAPK